MKLVLVMLLPAALLAACANPSESGPGDTGHPDAGDIEEAADAADAAEAADAADGAHDVVREDSGGVPPTDSLVYVQSDTELYSIDPGVSLALHDVGAFNGPCTSGSGLYDIALDGDGNMVGIAAEGLYAIDRDTAACTLLRAFPAGSPHIFSLSYVRGSDPGAPDSEALFGASVEQGEWVRIDPAGTTIATIFIHVGYYDAPGYTWVSSGDIVSIETGAGTYRTFATLKCSSGYTDTGCESDVLAEIDPVTGVARRIGPTGYQKVFGLGFWGDRVYGFTKDGAFIRIDVTTGAAELVSSDPSVGYWGAGTTTKPYVLI